MLACISIGGSPVWAQKEYTKSKKLLRTKAPGYQYLLQQARNTVEEEPLKAIDLLSEYLLKNTQTGDRTGEAQAYMLIGRANHNLAQHDLALENYQKALRPANNRYDKTTKFKQKPSLPTPLYLYMGETYLAKNVWDSAALHLQRYINDHAYTTLAKSQGLLQLGKAYFGMGQYQQAVTQAAQASQAAGQSKNNTLRAEALLLQGQSLEKLDRGEEAFEVLNDALEFAEQSGQGPLNKTLIDAISGTLRRQNKPAQALSFKKEALDNSVRKNDLPMQNALNLDIAQDYLDQNQPQQAIPYLNQSVEISEQTGNLAYNIQARRSLSDVYASQQNYSAALENYKKYVSLFDDLYATKQKEIEQSNEVLQDLYRNQEIVNLLEKDRQLSENQIQLLEKDRALKEESIARQSTLIYALVGFIALILGSGYLLYRNMSQKRIANQLLALKSLRSQMNPHFIFNALNSVNSFISKNDTRQANKYLTEFSRLMRTVMENSQEDFVPLSEEVSVLSLYLKLEHFRFQDKFEYEFVVDPDLSIDDFRIPPMLIQPYIENAIWHGLRYKTSMGFLSVKVSESDHALLMSITDDGIGRAKSKAIKTANQKQQQSTGMKNTENRVALLNKTFKSKIAIQVSDLQQGENTGTKVMVHIPKNLILQPC